MKKINSTNKETECLYFDAFSGVSGDMILGSLIHIGVDFNQLKNDLLKLPLGGYKLDCETRLISGIEAIKFNVHCEKESMSRNLSDILKLINDSKIDPVVKKKSSDIFNRIATAEAKIHGTNIDKVHFHEVGAVDSIIDIVGCSLALHSIGVKEIISSPLPFGKGFVKCAHGNMPLPAPATLEILKDFPTYGVNRDGEFVTPTGAAIIKSWVTGVGRFPKMKVNKIGYGAGSAEREIPNLLRVVLGEIISEPNITKELLLIETNIDDLNPEIIPYISEKLFGVGVLDFYTTQISMKKGRSGIKLSVLLDHHLEDQVLGILFRETTTLGVRKIKLDREELKRKNKLFNSSFGPIRIKESYLNKEMVNFKPEYDELKQIAEKQNISLKKLYNQVVTEYTMKGFK